MPQKNITFYGRQFVKLMVNFNTSLVLSLLFLLQLLFFLSLDVQVFHTWLKAQVPL